MVLDFNPALTIKVYNAMVISKYHLKLFLSGSLLLASIGLSSTANAIIDIAPFKTLPLGHGVGLNDFNSDFKTDFYTSSDGIANALGRNDTKGVFSNVAATVGVNDSYLSSRGVAWADYDGDGDQDLFVSKLYETSKLYKNNAGIFTDVIASSGIVTGIVNGVAYPVRMAAWVDYDGDQDLDLYLTLGAQNSPLTPKSGLTYATRSNLLYRNNGNGTFTDVTISSNVRAEGDWTWTAFADYNNDGWLDFITISGVLKFTTPNADSYNRFFHNNGNGTFTELTNTETIGNLGGKGRGAAWGDYNNDGYLDLFVTSERPSTSNILFDNRVSINNPSKRILVENATAKPNLENLVGRSCSFVDADGNGSLDLFMVGHLISDSRIFVNSNNQLNNSSQYAFASYLTQVGNIREGYGSAWGDFDSDGDLDLVVMSTKDTSSLMFSNKLSRSSQDFLFVRPVSNSGKQNAQGATVKLYRAGTLNLVGMRVAQGMDSYVGQGIYDAYFSGLSSTQRYDIEIKFPDGTVRNKNNLSSLGNFLITSYPSFLEVRHM